MTTVEQLPPRGSHDRPIDGREGGAGSFYGTADDIDLRELLRIFRRRKAIIFAAVVLTAIIGALVIWQITPMYTAKATVMVGARESQVVDIEAVLAGLPADAETIESEIQVIRSRGLASKVVDKLRLDLDPEFNSQLRGPSGLSAIFNLKGLLPNRWKAALFGRPSSEAAVSQEEAAERLRTRIVGAALANLEISAVGRSRVIQIDFRSQSARKAAAIANAIAEHYIVAQLEAKFEATERANAWLADRLAQLRTKVVASEREVEEFRRRSGLIQGRNVTLATEQISDLSTEMVRERTKRVEAEARLRQVERLLQSSNAADSLSEVTSSGLIIRLREQEAEVKRKVAELSEEYGDKHPRMINARAELRDLEQKISNEVNRIVEGLRNEVSVARAREASLSAGLDRLKLEVGDLNTSEVQLRALEREAEANRTLLETFLSRSKETENQESFLEADATILSRAAVPEKPSSPRRKLLLAACLVVGVVLGIILAIVIELFDQGFRSLAQVEAMAGIPGLGLVPMVSGLSSLKRKPEQYLLERPNSAYAEAIRSLRTSLALSDIDQPPKVVLIASSLPKEGKTALVLSLSYMVGSLGKRAIVVDCDLRRPSVHRSHDVALSPGLGEYLLGKATLDEIVRYHRDSGCFFITAGAPTPDPPELLGSFQMRHLLKQLAEVYDLVLLDSAPVLAVSDTRVLSRLVDKTVFLIRWAETRREVSLAALKQLTEAGANVAGGLLTRVDTRRHAQYGYGDSAYYHGKVRKYYAG